VVVNLSEAIDGLARFRAEVKLAPPGRGRTRRLNQHSTWFSQEA